MQLQKFARATDCVTLTYSIVETEHWYGFEVKMHILSVLTGLELPISAQRFKLKSPFMQKGLHNRNNVIDK